MLIFSHGTQNTQNTQEVHIMKYNLKSIMNQAWKSFKRGGKTFAEALHTAWYNAKAIILAKELAGIKEECHTWYSWRNFGLEVIHESVALFKVEVLDDTTKKGTRILSYFGKSQVHQISDVIA